MKEGLEGRGGGARRERRRGWKGVKEGLEGSEGGARRERRRGWKKGGGAGRWQGRYVVDVIIVTFFGLFTCETSHLAKTCKHLCYMLYTVELIFLPPPFLDLN